MSLQCYNQLIAYDDRGVTYDPSTGAVGEIATLNSKNGMAMEFQLNLKILSGRDKYKIRACYFTLVGQNESIDTNTVGTPEQIAKGLYGLMEAGARLASDIAFISKGVIVGLFCKIGKYRQDEMPMNVPTGDNSYASLVYDNQIAHEYGSQECDRNSELPVNPASTSVRVPWLRDDLSRQDVLKTFGDWSYTDSFSGFMITIGQVKFRNEQQTELIALPTSNLRKIKVAETSRPLGRLLSNNDASLGIMSDKVESELYNNFQEGTDDDSSNEEP